MPGNEGARRSEPNRIKQLKLGIVLLTAVGALVGSIYLGNKGIHTFDTPVDYCPVSGGYADTEMNVVVGARAGKIQSGLQTNSFPPEFIFHPFELSICRINGIDYLSNKFGKALELKLTSTGYLLAINNQPVLSFDETGNPKFSDDLDISILKDLIASRGIFVVAQPEPKVMTPTELKKVKSLAETALFGDMILLSTTAILGFTTWKLARNRNVLNAELAQVNGSAQSSSQRVAKLEEALRFAKNDNKILREQISDLTRNRNGSSYFKEDN